MNKCLFIFIIASIWCSGSSAALPPTSSLHPHFIDEQHLFQDPLSILTSSTGDIWFAYEDHILRQQGAKITKIIRPESNQSVASDRRPIVKMVDFGQHLLVAYNQKLLSINMVNNQAEFVGSADDKVIDFLITDDNEAMVLTLSGLFVLKYNGSDFVQSDLSKHIEPFVKNFLGCDLFKDSAGNIWLVTAFSQLIRLEWNHTNFSKIEAFTYDSQLIFYSITEIEAGHFLVGTNAGLVTFNLALGQYSKVKSSSINSSVYQVDKTSQNIIARTKSGLFFSQADLSGFEPFVFNLDHNRVGNELLKITTSFVDSEEMIWVSVHEKGVFKFSILKNQIKRVQLDEKVLEGSFNFATEINQRIFLSDNQSTLILEGSKQGERFYDELANRIEHPIFSAFALSKRQIVAGSNRKILFIENNKLINHVNVPDRFESKISSVTQVGDLILAVSNMTGLHVYDLQTELFSRQKEFANIQTKNIRFVAMASPDTLLVVTNEHYTLLRTNGFKPLKSSSLDWVPLKIEKQGAWVIFYGRENSIQRIDLNTGRSFKTQFPVESIECAFEKQDKSWVLVEKNGPLLLLSPEKQIISSMGKTFGMPIGGANGNICLLIDNSLIFSTYQGLVISDLATQSTKVLDSKTQIASVKVGDIDVKATQFSHGIQLQHDAFPLTLSLYNSSNLNTEPTLFEYRLLPAIDTWTSTENKIGRLIFNGLAPGDYQLQLRVQSLHAAPNEFRTINLQVKPSIWLSGWALAAYLVVISLVVLISLKIKSQISMRREAFLNRLVSEKTLALRNANAQLESILLKKEKEFGNLSHEIRTPLTLIIEPLEAIKQKKSYDPKVMDIIYRNSKRLLHIVEEMLSLEKIRVRGLNRKHKCSIPNTIAEVFAAFEPIAHKKEIHFSREVSVRREAKLQADSLHKILSNLVSNAIKYSKPGADVTISTFSNSNNDCEITVNNSPALIAPDQLDLIFNRFYRVVDSNSERETGSGLGLAIVKELAEANDCQITVESNEQSGTSFTLRIPSSILINQTTDKPIKAVDGSTNDDILDHAGSSSRPTVFVVEDNPDLNAFLCDLLADDYQYLSAQNGKEALEKIQQSMPDIILSDIMMPELDGLSLCKKLKSEVTTCHIPIILLTAKDDDTTRYQGWENLADALLTKPFKSKELKLRINNLLTNRQVIKRVSAHDASPNKLPSTQEQQPSIAKLDRKFLMRLDRFIENNYQSCTLNVDKIASYMAMSERQLQRKLKALTGHSINDYLKQHRLICAAQYLKDGHRVTEVADMAGFSSSAYFSKCFKEFYQMTPKTFQKTDKS